MTADARLPSPGPTANTFASRDSFRDSLTGRESSRGPGGSLDPPSGPRGAGDFRGRGGRGRGRGWRDDSRDRGRDREPDYRDRPRTVTREAASGSGSGAIATETTSRPTSSLAPGPGSRFLSGTGLSRRSIERRRGASEARVTRRATIRWIFPILTPNSTPPSVGVSAVAALEAAGEEQEEG